MAGNNSFNTAGATPNKPVAPKQNIPSATPYGKALNSVPSLFSSSFKPSTVTPSAPPSPGAVKSVTTVYHPPAESQAGLITPPAAKPETPITPAAPTPPVPPAPPANDTAGAYTGLIGKGVESLNRASEIQKKEADLNKRMETTNQGIAGDSNYSLDTQVGRQGLVTTAIGSELKGLAGEESAATSKGNAYLSGAGLLSPSNTTTQISPSSTLVNTLSGKPIAGLSAPGSAGATTMDDAVKQYAEKVGSKQLSYNDAVNALSVYGPKAQQSLLDALGPGFNVNTANANAQQQGDFTKNYNEGLAKLKAADNIQPLIVATLTQNPTLNQTPISAITNLNQWLSGQTSDPAQQVLSQQVANYISALGISPEVATQIATQKGGTIGTLLDNLRSTFVAQNEATNPKNLGSDSNGGSTGNFSEGQTTSSGGYSFVYKNGKWIAK